jgi:hypothetical protein
MTDADWAELRADFDKRLDAYMAEWEASLRKKLEEEAEGESEPPTEDDAPAD